MREVSALDLRALSSSYYEHKEHSDYISLTHEMLVQSFCGHDLLEIKFRCQGHQTVKFIFRSLWATVSLSFSGKAEY